MRIFTLLSILASLITFDPIPHLPLQDDAQKTAKAQELLKQSRSALGAEKVKTLSITGTSRQKIGEMETGGDLELEMMLPDKFYKASIMSPMNGIEITRMEVLNGENAWTDMQNNAPAGGQVVFRVGNATAGNNADAQKVQQQFIRQEWTRMLLGILAQSPAAFPLEYSYAGEAEAPDGVADVIEVKNKAMGFSAQLFLAQKTHLPLMLSYQGRKPAMRMVTRSISSEEAKKKTPEEMEKELKESREKAQAQALAEPLVEIQIRYEDFSSEGGVTLPHRISRSIDGQISEEWTLSKFKVNASIKPDKFEKK